MFSVRIACFLYAGQLVSLLVWLIGAFTLRLRQRKLQHAEWHCKAGKLFLGYCVLEFFRIVDCVYTDFDTGVIHSVWGVVPWWLRIYSWVLRDVLMFKGICVYLEHALVWTHSFLDCPVPKTVLIMQQIFCYFGNVVFFVGSTLFMIRNDQFWQPVCAMGQIPPNIGVALACFYLSSCLKQMPDCEELRHGVVVNKALLVAAFSVLCMFLPWAVPKMIKLYGRQAAMHATIPAGTSVLFASPTSFIGGDHQIDIVVEMVELTVGWCGFTGLLLPSARTPGPGEPLVLSSKQIGRSLAAMAGKKIS